KPNAHPSTPAGCTTAASARPEPPGGTAALPPQCCGSGRRHAGALLHLGRHPACVSAAHPQASSVKPTFTVTCQYATLPSRTWPRVSTTSNQLILRTVSLARSIAVLTASSILVVDEPVSSMLLYTWLLMMRSL